MLTFSQFKTGPAKRIAGACSSSDEFLDLTNDSVRQLMNVGNFWGTVQPMRGCIWGDCITWPRQVGSILAINSCNRPIPISNFWYSYMPWDESHIQCASNNIKNGSIGNVVVDNDGTTSVFNQIPCNTSMYLQFYITRPEDIGRHITVFGIDNGGQTIRTQRQDGTWQDGVVLTFALPFVQTTFAVRRVDRIIKDETAGQVNGFQWDGSALRDATNPLLFDLCHYEPSETNPDYIHSRIQGAGKSCVCSGTKQVSALVKLKYTPIKHDDDLVLIDNTDAIRDMIFSIREKEAGNLAQSQALELSSIRELNRQLRDRFPIEQFQVSFRPFGSASLRKQSIGSLI